MKSVELNGVLINVEAEEGVFPEGAILKVSDVTAEENVFNEQIEELRGESTNLATSYSFDIQILDSENNELQPKDSSLVKVSFTIPEISNQYLDVQIYHTHNNETNILDTEVIEDTVEVLTDNFSIYTVEFTYNEKQYVLEGGSYTKLSDILEYIGLSGEIKSWEISNTELFNIIMGKNDSPKLVYIYEPDKNTTALIATNDPEGNVPWVISCEPFISEEWLDVTMDDGFTYHIIVTDAVMNTNTDTRDVPGLYQGSNLDNNDFAALIPVADVWVDSSRFSNSGGYVSSSWNEFIPGELMDPNSSKYNPAFKVDMPTDNGDGTYGQSMAAEYRGKHFVVYNLLRLFSL